MANRTTIIPAIWAAAAANISGSPAEGNVYANSDITPTEATLGWKFGTIVPTEHFNEMMKRITTLLSLMETYGLLPWCSLTSYLVGSLVMGSDGIGYQSIVTPNLNNDPISSPSYWSVYQKDSNPVSTVLLVDTSIVPTGYLECDGSAISRTGYGALFSAIGVRHGIGNGSTTFNLPDFRGDFLRVWDHGRGIDSGRALSTRQLDSFKSHVHTMSGGGGFEGGPYVDTTSSIQAQTDSTDPAGGTETRPVNDALMAIIKY